MCHQLGGNIDAQLKVAGLDHGTHWSGQRREGQPRVQWPRGEHGGRMAVFGGHDCEPWCPLERASGEKPSLVAMEEYGAA